MSVPIVLPISAEDKEKVAGNWREAISVLWYLGRSYSIIQLPFFKCSLPGKDFVLTYEGKKIAIMKGCEIYEHRKEERCARQFGLTHDGHPYIKVTMVEKPNITVSLAKKG